VLIRILGSAAGGGFPQWNCGCSNCRGVREGLIKAIPRTQESACICGDDDNWFVINASPDIRSQIDSFPPLHPRQQRDSPIQAIFLTNGDLDHCLGLLSLRENQPIVVYATESVQRGFTEHNVLYRTLQRFQNQIVWRCLKLGLEERVLCADGRPSTLTVKAMAVPGKLPVHLEGRATTSEEVNVGLIFRQTTHGRVLAYLSSVGTITDGIRQGLENSDCVLFDGTFWSEDELSRTGITEKSARDLAHLPVGGSHGSLSMLSDISAHRRIFLHINNTNPLLREDSPERQVVHAAGWEVAYDGMEVRI
jgi:pyrroloquinoline quinone biosynthesis protein B